MKLIIRKFYLIALLVSLINIGFAQNNITKQTIHFVTGKYNIDATNTQLNELIATVKKYDSIVISIEGNTDNIGSYTINKKLSGIRANAVKKYLIQNGINENAITVKALASKNPIASNKTKKGRSLNRRVDAIANCFTKIKKEEIVIVEPIKKEIVSIQELYKQLATPMQSFCINPNKDTVLRCVKGTIIYIKANSIITNSNTGSCIQFNVKEDFFKSEMVLDNLSTTSNGEILESQGMIYTEALDSKGNKLDLVKGKDMVIMLPTDTIRSDAKIFDGQREHDSVMNWIGTNEDALLKIFSLNDINACHTICCNQRAYCKCKFFFCRIRRLPKAVVGTFNKNERESNKLYRKCLRESKLLSKPNPNDKEQKEILEIRKNEEKYKDTFSCRNCKWYDELLAKYGVKDHTELLEVINKELMDSLGVKSYAELKDTISKRYIHNIEFNYKKKKISYDDFKYYVFKSSKLGWINCDVFADIKRSNLIKIKVNIKPQNNITCQLIFKNRNAVISATNKNDEYDFIKFPKNELAYLVVLKYENGIPYLSMQEITTAAKTFEVKFKQYTLEQLKQELKKLD